MALAIAVVSLLVLRCRAYRRQVAFDTGCDCAYDFSGSSGKQFSVQVDAKGFKLPEQVGGFDTGFLEMKLGTSWAGRFLDPSLELVSGGLRTSVFFERGVSGTRQVNISPILAHDGRISLRGRHLSWKNQNATLRLWRNLPLKDDRILVVAPHPDDAEIAAHGLCSHRHLHIVTISAGNNLSWNLARLEPRSGPQAALAARLRTWDSLTVPWMAGILPERSIQLAFPDGRLAEMHAAPQKNFTPEDYDFAGLRAMNQSKIKLSADGGCSWESLLVDLRQIISELKPTLIVLPFPKYDNHLDHGFTTVAVCEALRTLAGPPARLLLYINHGLLTEHWPFGPAGTAVSLPPNHDGRMPVHGLWSRPLAPEAQREKLLALEAMHDLREAPGLGIKTWKEIFRTVRGEVGTKVHGLERRPNNYFRRAVRANELFFVATWPQTKSLAESFAAEWRAKGQ